ncbi:Putative uncharacterized protein [Taphrina deformans PYCC 5710]|uniref:Cyclin-like protein n=1 Tax=Taphrina deformans (strain PYCC 5710 / ATCC 11124 / CBS 356.35 / IMI 108563 / JCM 9778 / NBRC 8474) TaxID=1097556 RepID=R4X753_TAPDE|nr:Putative uncharacterized protein [Taphrina deformans PYCC 5710]|eukprot:CCG81117.2 Putative uncharacterized protein [Taphrina deformans PYCC 5710]
MAKPEFTKWTRDVLSTTQVSTNVVILAMLYIYRLKVGNPSVKGKAGSEYRLLTVALMLGNKFLDDNTYTNKTWADVTNIAVKEIHLMEVEFLSNMRYQLMVTVEEWQGWLYKINLFVRYQQKQQVMCQITPMPRGLPSPPVLYDHGSYIPIHGVGYSTPQLELPPLSRGRKRSLGDAHFPDTYNMLPPHKKMLSQPTTPHSNDDALSRFRYAGLNNRHDTSPTRHQQLQASLLRTLPPPGKYHGTGSLNFMLPHYQGTIHNSAISPSHLQAGQGTNGSSPTTSSISHFSSHSHGPALGYSPTSLALQHRNSPYAPVQPVQRLVGKYQPIFNPLQVNPQTKQSLWYNQVSAGVQQPVYHGKVPLSAQASPYGRVAKR